MGHKVLTIKQWRWKRHDRVGDITRNGEVHGVLFKGIRPCLGEFSDFKPAKLFGKVKERGVHQHNTRISAVVQCPVS